MRETHGSVWSAIISASRLDEGDSRERVVCDYISAMTDRFAIERYEELYIPKTWNR